MLVLTLASALVFSSADHHASARDAHATLESVRAALETESLRSYRNRVRRGDMSADSVARELCLWQRYVELLGRTDNANAQMAAEVETFHHIRALTDLDDAAFDAVAADILLQRAEVSPNYDPGSVRDLGLFMSQPYVRWALVQRGDGLGAAGQLLLAADRGPGDGLWWEEVDRAYWHAEGAGVDPALLQAFQSLLLSYVRLDFDQADYQWVQRSTGAEFMRNPSISLAFGHIDEARTLRAARGE